ncbi:hypothetical protein [Streptosporangium sp. NPDC006930]|uniref:hypothetical protein n=1 Tax=unclassified Streptosporangium TaxID=2632669 RepID=UPI003414116A
MNNPNAPSLDQAAAIGCGCFAEVSPMPMGCALCWHAPYAHGCPGQGAVDHDYVQPSRELMAVRLEAWRFGILLPASEAFVDAEAIPLVPAQRRPEQPASAAPTPLPKRTPRSFPRPDTRPVVAPPGRDDGPFGARRASPKATLLVVEKEAPVIPHLDPLAGDHLSATTWRPDAISALKHLRTELHTHRIYPEIAYDESRPRLVISSELTVWTDQAGTIFCWGACFLEGSDLRGPSRHRAGSTSTVVWRIGGVDRSDLR